MGQKLILIKKDFVHYCSSKVHFFDYYYIPHTQHAAVVVAVAYNIAVDKKAYNSPLVQQQQMLLQWLKKQQL
jgi:hypothetical protein